MEFDDVLKDVGGYGTYQKHLLFFILAPSLCLIPWFAVDIYFMLSTPDHWCFVSDVASSNLTLHQQKALIRPQNNPSCTMHDINYTEYLNSQSLTIVNNSQSRPCSNGWQYDTFYYDYTATSQWNLVCSGNHYVSLIFMLQNVGSIVGNSISGYISD
ncbi:beta-alanine transporter-like, partial [Stegodyphus dumicola]|uniref:beta-alanine transporter-like n=1 Tax=Stegodyphus dumicola TaxID=202533 RepID=UPI0015AF42BD